MGQVISLSEPGLDMVLYGNKSNVLGNYIQAQLNNLAPVYNEFSSRIYDSLQASMGFINDKLTQYGIMNQVQRAGLQVLDNYFCDLNSFADIQNANLTMQRFIMSHPTVKQLYDNQNIDGYSGSYVNVSGKGFGEDDYTYRRVMSDVLTSTDDHWTVNTYLEDLLPGDRELNHFEKVHILHSYDAVDFLLDNCNFDFTIKSEHPIKINRD